MMNIINIGTARNVCSILSFTLRAVPGSLSLATQPTNSYLHLITAQHPVISLINRDGSELYRQKDQISGLVRQHVGNNVVQKHKVTA